MQHCYGVVRGPFQPNTMVDANEAAETAHEQSMAPRSDSTPERHLPPPLFQYRNQLEQGRIRLIRSVFSEENDAMRHGMCFELEEIAIPTAGNALKDPEKPYKALSYAWGVGKPNLLINIDAHIFYVTENLFKALYYLREERKSSLFWVDAICINQEDDEEKVGQLRQMSNVYRYADHVIAFLGGDSKALDLAMDQVCFLGEEALKMDISIIKSEELKNWPNLDNVNEREKKLEVVESVRRFMSRQSGGLIFGPKIKTSAIIELLNSKWFTRAWVVQELTMARKNCAIFAYGHKRAVAEYLWATNLLICIWTLDSWSSTLTPNSMLDDVFKACYIRIQTGIWPSKFPTNKAVKILGVRHKYLQGELQLSLKDLLTMIYVGDTKSPLDCRDPRDKFFAVLSMSEDANSLDGLVESRPRSWHYLYEEIARFMIKQGHVDLLSLTRDGDMALPSWVPDWSRQRRQPWGGLINGKGHEKTQLFNAGRGTNPVIYDDPKSSGLLSLDGYRVDTINEAGIEWVANDSDEFDWLSAHILLRDLDLFLSRSTRYDGADKDDARWRIPIGDKEQNRFAQVIKATDVSRKAAETMKTTIRTVDFHVPGSESYLNMMRSMYDSRPFLSATGYIGLCPSATRS